MTKVIYKKSHKETSINAGAVVSLPAYRTRDDARAVANKLRARGVTPTTPVKTAEGWRVAVKHSGGVLSLRKNG